MLLETKMNNIFTKTLVPKKTQEQSKELSEREKRKLKEMMSNFYFKEKRNNERK